jgi:hypothetical protein
MHDLPATLRVILVDVGTRVAQMLRRVPDPAAPAIGEWSIGETAAHVAASGRFLLAVARGEAEPGSLDDVADHNAVLLAADPERDLHVLAGRVEASERDLAAHLEAAEGDRVVEVFRGIDVPLSTLAAVEIGELLVHGYDIARAARLPWEIPQREAAPTVTALLPLLPALADPARATGLTARFEVRVRGGGRGVVAIDDGAARLEPGGGPADCHLSVDPAAYLLLGFGRTGIIRPLLGGKLMAWGRRLWLAPRFPSLFRVV